MSIDPLAWTALGFLVLVVAVGFVLSGWVAKQMKKERGER
jgi:hypothetical protein